VPIRKSNATGTMTSSVAVGFTHEVVLALATETKSFSSSRIAAVPSLCSAGKRRGSHTSAQGAEKKPWPLTMGATMTAHSTRLSEAGVVVGAAVVFELVEFDMTPPSSQRQIGFLFTSVPGAL
ncbi:MAG: hypothetical protein V4671_15455, partial [Armatimonadota bacterium]